MSAFTKTLSGFCDELRLTFPELTVFVDRAASTVSAAHFWSSWSGALDILLERDVARLMSERRGFLVGAVRLTESLWGELSANTQTAIWRYLRTLVLEAAMEANLDSLSTETMSALMAILTAERLEKGGEEADAAAAEMMEDSMAHLTPLMERLKGMLGGLGEGIDLSGMTMPEIPERLRNGRIAKLAEEMAKQFRPEEFGIDPALLVGDNVEEILRRLAELYQRDPTLLITGAKRVAERIKNRIMSGSLNRDELVAEAQEFVTLFKEHPMFKDALEKFQGLMGEGGLAGMFGGGSGSGAPSERRRAVQERLRRKMEARKAAGGSGTR